MNEIQAAIQMEKEAKNSYTYLDMWKTKGNRHRLFISVTVGVYAQINGVAVVSYYLTLVLEVTGISSVTDQTLINVCLQIWNLIFAVLGAVVVDRIGRRPLFLTSCIGMLISCVLITALSGSFVNTGNAQTGIAVIPFLFFYYAFYDIAFTPLIIACPAEIWNYTFRARGMAVVQLSSSIAVAFNIFVSSIALTAIGWKYYLVFVVLLIFITLTCYFFYPETRGHDLEHMVEVFDGKEAVQAMQRTAEADKSSNSNVEEVEVV